MFAAVFAAPPSTCLDESTFNTGTGASGEILLQSPRRYSSRMASPTTSTRRCVKSDTHCARGSVFSFSVMGSPGAVAREVDLATGDSVRQRSLRFDPWHLDTHNVLT